MEQTSTTKITVLEFHKMSTDTVSSHSTHEHVQSLPSVELLSITLTESDHDSPINKEELQTEVQSVNDDANLDNSSGNYLTNTLSIDNVECQTESSDSIPAHNMSMPHVLLQSDKFYT